MEGGAEGEARDGEQARENKTRFNMILNCYYAQAGGGGLHGMADSQELPSH